jgi:hypothetical protein
VLGSDGRPAAAARASGIKMQPANGALIAERIRNLGIDARGNSPAELEAWMRAEIARWARIARDANLKTE